MATDWTDNRKNLMLFSGRAHPELAEQVAKELDVSVTAQTARSMSATRTSLTECRSTSPSASRARAASMGRLWTRARW